jgi:predicted nucleic acid-binding protein
LPIKGLLGVLADAKKAGLIGACAPLIESLIEVADFWLAPALLQRFLRSVGEA